MQGNQAKGKRCAMDDLISRQAAINAIENTECELLPEEWDELTDAIMNVPSAQRWIPVTERLPENFEEVNITWVNHDPEQYYAAIKDVPFVASGVFYKGRWYWWSAVCADYLREYGNSPNNIMDESIEVIAWMPMPAPFKGNGTD